MFSSIVAERAEIIPESGERAKSNYYYRHAGELRRRLTDRIPREELRMLHVRSAWRHLILLIRQYAILGLATYGLIRFASPWIWIPLAFVQGFTIFNFTVLLHEVVHNTVLEKRSDGWMRFLGWLYALPSGISRSQFTRWHLDHHAELGSDTSDPKRFHLSPKVNARWYKLLYWTPALFFIYFRAAHRETETYEPELQREIRWERRFTLLFHLVVAAAIGLQSGASVLVRVYAVPVFLVFPIAFALNRLGQHYDIDREDPAKWSTLINAGWFWNFVFMYSSYHLEHHYFPSVPFYNLPRLNNLLQPFYREIGLESRTYRQLVWRFLVLNKTPHSNWA